MHAQLEEEDFYYYVQDGVFAQVAQVRSDLILQDYLPHEGDKVATLSEEPTLSRRVSDEDPLPRLDGATALLPVYSAFVQAVYPKNTRFSSNLEESPLITCTKTNEAYERLINGEADLIFVAQPSDEQYAMAAAQGVEFEFTPIGKEAFVFIVNQSNPLDGLTIEQIQQIYAGNITAWDQLGLEGLGDIIAYQRPKNSGSQTALEALMGDIPLMDAPSERTLTLMDEIVENIEYLNLPNAIGYTFRFFCTEMMDSEVKLLSVNGVYPREENIRNGTYPITSTLYAVSRKGDDNPNLIALLEWIQSPQGMELVEKTGYTPWTAAGDQT